MNFSVQLSPPRNGHLDVVRALVEAGADKNKAGRGSERAMRSCDGERVPYPKWLWHLTMQSNAKEQKLVVSAWNLISP